MAAPTNKRIMSELTQSHNNPLEGVTVSLPDESNVNLWTITMTAPSDSVYHGGTFKIDLTLPKDYPFKPPVLNFRTKIYHPNVSNDDKGSICLGMLRSDQWKPPNKIREVLALVRQILSQPQPDDAVETSIATEYSKDYKSFEKTARDWVSKYAK